MHYSCLTSASIFVFAPGTFQTAAPRTKLEGTGVGAERWGAEKVFHITFSPELTPLGSRRNLLEKRPPAEKGKFMLTFGFISSASNSAVSAQPPHSCPLQPAGLRRALRWTPGLTLHPALLTCCPLPGGRVHIHQNNPAPPLHPASSSNLQLLHTDEPVAGVRVCRKSSHGAMLYPNKQTNISQPSPCSCTFITRNCN